VRFIDAHQELVRANSTYAKRTLYDMRTIPNAIKTCVHEAHLEISKVQQIHDEILASEQVSSIEDRNFDTSAVSKTESNENTNFESSYDFKDI
jgi:hypothetical protein